MKLRNDEHVWGQRVNETVWSCRCGVKRQRQPGGYQAYYYPITGRWSRKRPACPVYAPSLEKQGERG